MGLNVTGFSYAGHDVDLRGLVPRDAARPGVLRRLPARQLRGSRRPPRPRIAHGRAPEGGSSTAGVRRPKAKPRKAAKKKAHGQDAHAAARRPSLTLAPAMAVARTRDLMPAGERAALERCSATRWTTSRSSSTPGTRACTSARVATTRRNRILPARLGRATSSPIRADAARVLPRAAAVEPWPHERLPSTCSSGCGAATGSNRYERQARRFVAPAARRLRASGCARLRPVQ